MYDWLIVGAGFAGSVLAERLANIRNESVLLADRRPHVGGNGSVLALEMPEDASLWSLYRNGALLVGKSGMIAGCAAWMRV